jgi:SAM-dependent methyltransferase
LDLRTQLRWCVCSEFQHTLGHPLPQPPRVTRLLPLVRLRYWDEFFRDWERRSGDSAFEWYGDWKDIAGDVVARLPARVPRSDIRVLVIGCGNSSLSADMFAAGFTNVVSIDFSEEVIGRMRAQHVARPGLVWEVMDAKAMAFPDASFDLVVDKVRPHACLVVCCGVLFCGVLCCGVLCCGVLWCAMQCCAMLWCAVLHCVRVERADFDLMTGVVPGPLHLLALKFTRRVAYSHTQHKTTQHARAHCPAP